MEDLFAELRPRTSLGEGAVWLPGFAGAVAGELVKAVEGIAARAPFRKLQTPGGRPLSVAMTSCGACGWHSDRGGYRYVANDPLTGLPWPEMPECFRGLAVRAAAEAGFAGFEPLSCLINRYEAGARMGLHQDRDEGDMAMPIVSVSLGVPARFAFGGVQKAGPVRRMELLSGDVVVWGGASRLAWHGVSPVRETFHPLTGCVRYNLTFRAINGPVFQS